MKGTCTNDPQHSTLGVSVSVTDNFPSKLEVIRVGSNKKSSIGW